MFCKNCGKEINDNAYVCVHCGVRTSDELPLVTKEETKFCTHCGKQIDPKAYICVHCGVKVGQEQAVSTQNNSSSVPLILAIFSMLMTLVTVTFLGAILSIVGMSISLVKKDIKGIKINLVAIIFCVVISLVALILGFIK